MGGAGEEGLTDAVARGREELGAETTQHVEAATVGQAADCGLDRQLHIYYDMHKGKGHLFSFYAIGPLCSCLVTSSGGLCLYNRDNGQEARPLCPGV